MSAPTWGDIASFCKEDEWELDRETKHMIFKKVLADGTALRTEISRGKATRPIGRDLFRFILRTQLLISEDEFWRTIREKRPAERPTEEIGKVTHDEAVRLLNEHYSRPRDEER